jgi:ketosteroid isomerase-like protein
MGPMTIPDAEVFARDWCQAWNARDVEAVLAHFRDDVVFSSPVAGRLVPESGGVVHGKDALRDYWTTALQANPDLRFEVVATYAGTQAIVINYRNQLGALVNEVLIFDGDLVCEGHGTYLA